MDGGSSTTHVVVVHAWKVVMHERVGVNDLDRRGEWRRIALPSGGPIRREKEDSAKAFAAPE